MKSAVPAEPGRRAIFGLTLVAALVHAAESRGQEVSPSPDSHRTGSLVSGLSKTPPEGHRTDVLLASPEAFAPTMGAAGLASRIAAAEGGPRPNPASSASGYGQFLRGTWLEIFGRAYPQLAQRLSADQILALREIKPLALDLTNRYAQQNAFTLQRVGLAATDGSLSLAHAVGAGGAINVLVSQPDQRVENLLSHEAITANPFLREMTASSLQQWAANRIRPSARQMQPAGAAPRVDEPFEPIRPAEDFRIDSQTMASQAMSENRKAITVLHNLLEAASKTGAGTETQVDPSTAAWLNSIGVNPTELLLADPKVVGVFNKHAARLLLQAIHGSAIRVSYSEFKSIENNAGAARELSPSVIRDVASALIGKLRRENATIISIVRHRRSARSGRPAADTATFVLVNNGANSAVALQGPAIAQLANVVSSTFPNPLVPITAQNTGVAGGGTVPDPSPIANVSLTSQPLFFLNTNGQTLSIDLTGNSLPATPLGAGFNVTPVSVQPVVNGVPSQTVSTAGFLGTLSLFVNTSLDARNGLGLNASNPQFTNGSLTGAVTVILFGDFATITNAYLLPNNSVPAGNISTCAPTPPANAIPGSINAAKNAIGLTGLGNPGNPAFNGNVQFSVCLVTNGTQVVQQSNGGPGGGNGIGIIGSVTVGGIANPIPLTQPNQTFGNISYNGSVFFAQNVFGSANLYPVFFRAINQGNTPAQIWAVLTKDVNNVSPETGAGSCNNTAAILAASPQPAPTGSGNSNTGCNTSFVANLTAVSDPTGLSRGLLQPNTGAYYFADAIAAQAGTTLPAGSNKATVFLLSPNAGLVFSALSQLTTPGAPPIITSLP